MSHAAAVSRHHPSGASADDPEGDGRRAMLEADVERARLRLTTAGQQLKRALDAGDLAAEAAAAEAVAAAASRLAGSARLLSVE